MRRTLLFSTVFLLLANPVLAETTFITDKIVVELFSSTHQRGIVVTSVKTGTTVEVVEVDGDYSKVRTSDNLVGWLHSKYLSTDKPTQIQYLQLMAKHKQLQEEMNQIRSQMKNTVDPEKENAIIAKIRNDLKKAKTSNADLENKLKEKSKQLTEIQTQLAALKKQLSSQQSLKSQQKTDATDAPGTPTEASSEAVETSAPVEAEESHQAPKTTEAFGLEYPLAIKWTLIASLLCTLLGIYLGHAWLDAKIRKRHGGVRIR